MGSWDADGAAKCSTVPTLLCPRSLAASATVFGHTHHVHRKGCQENLTHIPIHRGVYICIGIAKMKGWNLAGEEAGPSKAVWKILLVVAKPGLSKRLALCLYNLRSLESNGKENYQGSRVRRGEGLPSGEGAGVGVGRPREGHWQQGQWEFQASLSCPLASGPAFIRGLSPGSVKGHRCQGEVPSQLTRHVGPSVSCTVGQTLWKFSEVHTLLSREATGRRGPCPTHHHHPCPAAF